MAVTAKIAYWEAEAKRLRNLLDYGTDTSEYRRLRAELERLRAANARLTAALKEIELRSGAEFDGDALEWLESVREIASAALGHEQSPPDGETK